MSAVIVWFRRDLRLEDNPAWKRAVESGRPVIPVYILDDEEGGDWSLGSASRWWLHYALEDLQGRMEALGSRLILRRGRSGESLQEVITDSGATAVYWNRCYEPWRVREDGRVKAVLQDRGLEAWSGNSTLLREPWEVATQQGSAFKVYTPFAKACARVADKPPLAVPVRKPALPDEWPAGLHLGDLQLLPRIRWDNGLEAVWQPTRRGALKRLDGFLGEAVGDYKQQRDFPGVEGTSRLSPYLHWGQIGPREVVARLSQLPDSPGKETYYRELIWREFAYHVLYHFPDTPVVPLQPAFKDFPWEENAALLRAWQRGLTGYPIVDAGMRELWQTGWMHNRVRMIVASLLVKHLLHSWIEGARWFWDTLVDADLASNTLGWQWAGGCGADAAPYFRIFNPILQGKKFDPDGTYIRTYVPELKDVPDAMLHCPWELSPAEQLHCNCRIGTDYPEPVIDHAKGRDRALQALEAMKAARTEGL